MRLNSVLTQSLVSKFICTLIILSVCVTNNLFGSEFDNEYNHYSGVTLKRLKICGERCSGTNFVTHLIQKNFPDLRHTDCLEFGQKHFLWWFGTPEDQEKLTKLRYSRNAVDLSNSEDCLFVVIVRDPYDWLRSFYNTPWYVHEDLLGRSFFHFVSSEWGLGSTFFVEDGQFDEIDNCNPWTGQPFMNVLQLRKYKTLNYLALYAFVDNYLIVRYEDVRDNPEEFINFVACYFHLEKTDTYASVNTYKGVCDPYVRKNYFPIDNEALEFINSQIDWEIEDNLGYSLKTVFCD